MTYNTEETIKFKVMNLETKKIIEDIKNMDTTMTREEQEELDLNIYNQEKKVNNINKLTIHTLLSAAIVLISMFSVDLVIFQVAALLLLSFAFLYLRKEMIFHSCVLSGMKQPIDEFIADVVRMFEEDVNNPPTPRR
jgi:hypothetical protein